MYAKESIQHKHLTFMQWILKNKNMNAIKALKHFVDALEWLRSIDNFKIIFKFNTPYSVH